MILRLGDETDGLEIDTRNGARLSSLVLGGRERLIGQPFPADVEPALSWGCFLMAPFVGRVSRGRVEWQGERGQLPLNHGRHAIHGAALDVPWGVTSSSANAAVITCRLDPGRWPFGGTLAQRIAIARGKLLLEAEVRADEAMPAALGWHPWFRRDGDMRVRVASERVLRLGDESLPTGDLDPVSGDTDLRDAPRIEGRARDHVFVSVSSPVSVTWPDLELTMGFEAPVGSVLVYVHPEAVCVEPITAWPDAIRLAQAGCTGTGLVSLKAGERLTAATTWSWQAR